MHRRRGSLVLLVFLAACASASPTPSSGARPQHDVITEAEIAKTPERNAYEVIQALRPSMLVRRGATSISNPQSGIVVFLDNQKFSDDLGALKNLAATNIHEIRFLNAGDAQARWGPGYSSGVILVTTKGR